MDCYTFAMIFKDKLSFFFLETNLDCRSSKTATNIICICNGTVEMAHLIATHSARNNSFLFIFVGVYLILMGNAFCCLCYVSDNNELIFSIPYSVTIYRPSLLVMSLHRQYPETL